MNHDEDDNKSENEEIRKSLVLSGTAVSCTGERLCVRVSRSAGWRSDRLSSAGKTSVGWQRCIAGIHERCSKNSAYHAGTRLCAVIPVAACGTGGACACRWPGSFAGYLGMFCLLGWAGETSETLRRRKGLVGFIAMLTGCMYAYLPFLPVYGLSQYGLPLLMYCVLRLGEKDRPKNFRILCYFYVVFFGANSSLVLSGFAVLGIWAVWEIVTLVDKGKSFRRTGIAAWIFLLLTYLSRTVLCFAALRRGRESTVSHKGGISAEPGGSFWEQLKTNLLQGGQHSVDYHGLILVVLLMTTVVLFYGDRRDRRRA